MDINAETGLQTSKLGLKLNLEEFQLSTFNSASGVFQVFICDLEY